MNEPARRRYCKNQWLQQLAQVTETQEALAEEGVQIEEGGGGLLAWMKGSD